MDIVVKGRNVEVPDHFRVLRGRETCPVRAVRPQDHPSGRRVVPRDQPPPAQDVPAGPDHRRQPRSGGPRGGQRGELLRRPGRRSHQGGDPAAPVCTIGAGTANTAGPRSPPSPPRPRRSSGPRSRRPTVPSAPQCSRTSPVRSGPTRAGRTRTAGSRRTAARAGSSESRTTRPIRSRWTRRCCRWNSSATTSTCSTTRRPACASVVYRRHGLRLRPASAQVVGGPAARCGPGARPTPARPRGAPTMVTAGFRPVRAPGAACDAIQPRVKHVVLGRLLRVGEAKTLKRLRVIADHINAIEDDYVAMSDDELRGQTAAFKERLAKGETTDDLLVEAFAVVREAAKRTLGQRHFDVQLMGGAALHLGNIAEMKTGEGKTLVSTLPAYLNALEGKGVHIVTVNDYLAKRDSRVDGPGAPVPRAGGRRHPGPADPGRAARRLRRGHHLRHQQRVRLRLPARQHGLVQERPGAARPLLRASSTRSTRS